MEQIDEPKLGLVLYGFDDPPPLDVKINWTVTHNASIQANFQKAGFHFGLIQYFPFFGLKFGFAGFYVLTPYKHGFLMQ